MKTISRLPVVLILLLFIMISCTKEITEDLFNFKENFFTLQISADKNEVELEELVNFTLELQENELPSVYTIDFSTNQEGVFRFDGNAFGTSELTTIDAGIYEFTYLPTSEGIHELTYTITNANEIPRSLSDTFSIRVGDVSELETDFILTITSTPEVVEIRDLVTVNVNIIEEADVPENTVYTIDFGASGTGSFVFEEENYGNEGQVTIEETELIFQFIPEEAIEYDLKFSVTSQFNETSICESAIFMVETSSPNSEIPVIHLNGENPLVLTLGDEYIETATVTDNIDTDIEIIFGGDFDGTTNTVGEFTRTYNATDSDNNMAEEQIRAIIIQQNDEPILIESITITPVLLELAIDNSQQLTATLTPQNPVPTNPVLEWTSSNESVAAVNGTGLVTAISEGSAEITATSTDGSGISSSIMVEVKEAVVLVSEITIQNGVTPLDENQQETFSALIAPVNATNQSVLWTSSNPEVATVNEVTGLVSAVGEGETTISVETLDGSNLEDSFILVVEEVVNTLPVASILADMTTGEVPLTVNFDGSDSFDAEDEELTYVWELDGAGFETTETASWTFESAGEYVVELKVWDSVDAEGSDSITIIVTEPNAAPVASIASNITNGEAPLRVDFDGTDSFDSDDDELTYVWAIDGASFETSDTASWIFQDPGEYEVELTVTDSNGLVGLDSIIIVVTESNTAPIASFTTDITSGEAPLTVQFDATGTTDVDGDNLSYEWFENGMSFNATEAFFERTFTEPGIYEIELVVSDGNEGNDMDSVTITVEDPFIPITGVSITTFVTNFEAGENFRFIATVIPDNATNKDDIIWSTTDNGIISIDSETGEASWQSDGNVTITATAGNFEDSIEVEADQEDDEDDDDPTGIENPG